MHTPTQTPWSVYHENGSMGSGGHWGIQNPIKTVCIMAQNATIDGAEARANAALIVQAVNAHESLCRMVNRLVRALDQIADDEPNAPISWKLLGPDSHQAQARKLLATLDGKE